MSDIYLYNNEMWRVKYDFRYTGTKEPFRLNPGRYLCICKGARGGTWDATHAFQNKGGCSYGILNLKSPLEAFAVVGGDGKPSELIDGKWSRGHGGFNGGGTGGISCKPDKYRGGSGGGGASDIRLAIDDAFTEDENEKYLNLPEEYQQLEYISNSGRHYIDIGIKPSLGMKFIIDFKFNTITEDSWFAGAVDKNYYGIEAGWYVGKLYDSRGFTYSSTDPYTIFTATGIVDNNLGRAIDYNFYIFARNVGGTADSLAKGNCYRVTVIDETGATIMDLIPCRRKSDDVIGMYDMISGEMFVDAAGGGFDSGPEVSKTVITNREKPLNSRIMVAGGGGGCQLISHTGYSDLTGFGGGVYGGFPCTKSGLSNNGVTPSQTSGYSFGNGQDAPDRLITNSYSDYGAEGIGGAGGGWYGGYASQVPNPTNTYSQCNGGGGSGYILTDASYKPSGYMFDITERDDIYFSDTLMTSGLAQEACVIICEVTDSYFSGDRLICDCIGQGTSFTLYQGTYHIRCNGGSGAHRTKGASCARGGYAEGTLNVPDMITAYAYVGGSGSYVATNKGATFTQTTHPTHCFNGGGKPAGYTSTAVGGTAAGGGTDLRLGTDSLFARVIVAGGAGGSGSASNIGGIGGGLQGGESGAGIFTSSGTEYYGPGTQTKAGSGTNVSISGGFGYGGNGANRNDGFGGAGGGGWYGGSGVNPDSNKDDDSGGAGGSGYVLTANSHKPEGYLLDESSYLTETQLISGGAEQLYDFPITGMIIDVLQASSMPMLVCDQDGYKYYDWENNTWTFLKSDGITVSDFETYGSMTFPNDVGLGDSYDVYVLDELNLVNGMEFNVLPPKQSITFRYHTPLMMSHYNIDSDVDADAIDFNVTTKRRGIAEDAFIYFTFEYDMHRLPDIETRVYSVQGFTHGSSWKYQEPTKKEKTLEHIDLLPVGSATRMPARFKNYIGSFINGTEAIKTINSAVVCEHSRCIYSATLCNNTIVRFAKLNLVTNTSTIIKDIPKTQLGNTYYGDIKVDDNYIYISSSLNDGETNYTIWRTPNSSDTTVNAYSVPKSEPYRINSAGRMEWWNDHTLVILLHKGLAFFDTVSCKFTYKMAPDGSHNSSRREMIVGKKYILSLYVDPSESGYVIDPVTNTWKTLKEDYNINWASVNLNAGCYHDGVFYVVQRNRLHFIDEETMTLISSIPTPFTDIDPKLIVYGGGILYILMQNKPSLYMYDIKTQNFYAAGLPFTVDNWLANGWIRMCAFRGYCFIPQIRLYAINFVDRSKYNLGYKYDQFVIATNKSSSEIQDNQYEYDDRFVTFTEDNMWIHEGNITLKLEEVDASNRIKMCTMTKDQYNKILKTRFLSDFGDDESEGT